MTPPSARNGPSGIDCLRASLPWRTKRTIGRHERDEEPDEHRDDDRDPEPSAEEGGELDVAHADAPRVDEDDQEEHEPGAERRQDPLDARIVDRPERRGRRPRRAGRPCPESAGLEVGARDHDEDPAEDQRDERLERESEDEAAAPPRSAVPERDEPERGERGTAPQQRDRAAAHSSRDGPRAGRRRSRRRDRRLRHRRPRSRFPDSARLPATRADASDVGVPHPGDGRPSIWGRSAVDSSTTVGVTAAPRKRGRTATSGDEQGGGNYGARSCGRCAWPRSCSSRASQRRFSATRPTTSSPRSSCARSSPPPSASSSTGGSDERTPRRCAIR